MKTKPLIGRKTERLPNFAKKINQTDKFLRKIQQPKMKELWNNKENEIWDLI